MDDKANGNLAHHTQERQNYKPWLDLFYQPRATTRWLLQRETPEGARMLWFAFIAMTLVFMFVMVFLTGKLGQRPVTKMELVWATPFVFLLGWVFFTLQSHLYWTLSNMLGGKADKGAMKVVVAYTTVIPGVVFGAINYGLAFFLSRGTWGASLADNLFFIWSVYITLCSVATAAEFPAWKACAVYLLSILTWIAGAVVFTVLFGGKLF